MKRFRQFSFEDNDHELVNLTPLLDVLFVVLVLFIIISPLINIEEVNLTATTKSSSHQRLKETALKIYLLDTQEIKINGHLISLHNLPLCLQKIHDADPSISVQLFPDGNTHFATFQKVKDALENAGYTKVEVVLKKS